MSATLRMMEKFVPKTNFESYEDFYANYEVNVPDNFNFAWDVFDVLSKEMPHKKALVWCDELGAEAVFTYKDLSLLSNRAANVFTAAGIGKGDPVMLMLKRRYEYWPAVLALHKIGAVTIPATHLLAAKDIVYRIKAAGIVSIVCTDDADLMARVDEAEAEVCKAGTALRFKAFARSVHALAGENPAEKAAQKFTADAAIPLSSWGDFNGLSLKAGENFSRSKDVNANDDRMLIFFTSGTTGMPKMVSHNWTYPLGHIVTARYWQQVEPDGLHLTVADTGWAKAAWGKIYGQWICGSAVFVYDYDRFVPKAMLETVTKHRVTTFCAPPTIYRFFIKEDLSKYDFSCLKHCTVAGEPLNPEIYEAFFAGTGIKLKEGYGQTEMTVALGTFPWLEPKPGSMGKPSPGYDVAILGDNGSPCGMGEEGQIAIRTGKQKPVGMFNGYYRDETLTKSVWRENVYYTGDVAWMDEDGYYWFVGRTDDVIKSSGYRIGPFEVESALQEHPAVLESAVTGVPDPERGTIVKATVVLAKGWVPSEELKTELQDHVKKTTAPYKYPRIVEFATELPKTISGKIRRIEIRAQS